MAAAENGNDFPPRRVTIWNEFVHEQRDPSVRKIYPEGMHAVIGAAIERHLGKSVSLRYATFEEPEHGLNQSVLETTDVLTWWGHFANNEVADEVVERVVDRVQRGMGLVVLHAGHYSKVFRRLMGTSCVLRWRSGNDRQIVWPVNPGHPICEGIHMPIVIERDEMYGEFFDIPQPDDLVFVSSFSGGEVFRSGCCFVRGRGRIFYFSPGDQEYPVYYNEDVTHVIANAVRWCTPVIGISDSPKFEELEVGWFEKRQEEGD